MWKQSIAALVLASSCYASADSFTLSSPAVSDGGTLTSAQVFSGFGCSGENVSPALNWSGAPEGTQSYALTVYDPDAPTGSGWWHWQVINIPAEVQSLPTGAGTESGNNLPESAQQGPSDYGVKAFGGACPPEGDEPHRYEFTLYALGTDTLQVPENASAALIGFMINANKIGEASFTAMYGR
ncbi:YbhB/YbcL family Raf kinase inhibitor-like protein [Gilvimarinus xylanilyticus]|uniref:YbhB/YbcL family Raf kinase inhibitor-like protein n=1 Tax=Gilvimarinus xylanilyticus TaxID=2944139 RepID=A0A9X2KTS3_9GAMM|nr:YbhB/YbcL family Raf kinase inhibitor-like protein [Gilvimarinus xylanilyticus]MCP8899594.1 YbhB/YbcL family Raf kinase inhibitor-like protein [Gilvimarinus xylanilyticus]